MDYVCLATHYNFVAVTKEKLWFYTKGEGGGGEGGE